MPNLLIVVAIVVCVAILRRLWDRYAPHSKAMKRYARDLVDHPEYHEAIAAEREREYEQLQKRVEEARRLPPPQLDEIPNLIADLLSSSRTRVQFAQERLEKSKTEAEPLLLTALDDPRISFEQDGLSGYYSSPARRVISLLESIPSRALGEKIGHRTDDSAIRAKTALGRLADLPFVLAKLAEQSAPAQEGVELGIRQSWLEPGFLDAIAGWAKATVQDDSRPFSYWAVGFHAKHGGSEALEYLQSPRMLSTSNRNYVHAALKQLNRHRIILAPSVVRPLLEKSIKDREVWPWNCLYLSALVALGRTEPQEAQSIAESHLDLPSSRIQSDSADYIRATAGLPSNYFTHLTAEIPVSDEERELIDALNMCVIAKGEIGNGGLSQYFFNSTGNEWRRHVVAFRQIGFETGADAIDEAAHLLNTKGASADRDRRIAEYARLSERREKRLDELSVLFYPSTPLLRFMLRHVALFRRIREMRVQAGLDDPSENDLA